MSVLVLYLFISLLFSLALIIEIIKAKRKFSLIFIITIIASSVLWLPITLLYIIKEIFINGK